MKTTELAAGAASFKIGSENCLPVGTRLADFEITGILGEGGFGIVYIAYDHSLQRTVAIKEYMPGALAMRAADHSVAVRAERHQETFNVGLKSFISEARFLAQFDHPALVKVYRYWEQNRTAYTAMQYYEGRTVKDIVENSPELVDEAWCRKILRQILQALERLYTMKILHRDIAPDNIIVQENGDAVLLDFGSARQIIGDMTKGLTVILKPGYAPVEQYAGDASLEQGPWTDIYALAAVMYFAITKAPPPTSIARMIKDPMVPLRGRALEGYSEALLGAVDSGLGVLAQDRPQTIDAFRDLLGIVSVDPAPVRPAGAAKRNAPAPRAAEPAPAAAPAAGSAQAAAPAPSAASAPARSPEAQEALLEAALAAHDPTTPPLPRKSRWIIIAIAAGLLVAAGGGIYSLLRSAAGDTIMLALPQTPPASAPAVASAQQQVRGLDPTETVIEPPAPAATSQASAAPVPVPASAALAAAPRTV
ncbi:MAG TPA: serine/threonine-protein kinase, partial [Telluria sp.]|nr:serine/threonine-protein kinase [Telluria sp.]